METPTVFTVNVTEVFPAAMVTDAGTVADLELLESLTTIPPVGAGPLRVKVPVEVLVPATDVGFNVRDTI